MFKGKFAVIEDHKKTIALIAGIFMVLIAVFLPPTSFGIGGSSADTSTVGEITDPTEGQVITTTTYTVHYNAGTGSATWQYSLNGGDWTDAGNGSFILNGLASGSYNLKLAKCISTLATGSDSSSSSDSTCSHDVTDQVNFTVSVLLITIIQPDGGDVYRHSVTLTWNVTFSGAEQMKTNCKVDDGDWIGGGTETDSGTYTFSETFSLPDGPHTFYIRAQTITPDDTKYSQQGITVMVDPYVVIESPRNNTEYTKTYMNIDWSASGVNKTITGFDLQMDNTTVSLGSSVRTYNWTQISEGSHRVTITMYLNDSTNITHWVVFTTNYSEVKNIVHIISPREGEHVNGSIAYTIRWNTTLPTSYPFLFDISDPEYNDNQFTYNPPKKTDSFQINYTFAMNGGWNISIRLEDGNLSNDIVAFYSNYSYPSSLVLNINVDSIVYEGHSITIKWEVNSSNTFDHSEVCVDNGSWIRVNGTEYTFRELSYKKHIVSIRVYDVTGYWTHIDVPVNIEEKIAGTSNSNANNLKTGIGLLAIPAIAYGTVNNEALYGIIGKTGLFRKKLFH